MKTKIVKMSIAIILVSIGLIIPVFQKVEAQFPDRTVGVKAGDALSWFIVNSPDYTSIPLELMNVTVKSVTTTSIMFDEADNGTWNPTGTGNGTWADGGLFTIDVARPTNAESGGQGIWGLFFIAANLSVGDLATNDVAISKNFTKSYWTSNQQINYLTFTTALINYQLYYDKTTGILCEVKLANSGTSANNGVQVEDMLIKIYDNFTNSKMPSLPSPSIIDVTRTRLYTYVFYSMILLGFYLYSMERFIGMYPVPIVSASIIVLAVAFAEILLYKKSKKQTTMENES
jgi:hypothetical protein